MDEIYKAEHFSGAFWNVYNWSDDKPYTVDGTNSPKDWSHLDLSQDEAKDLAYLLNRAREDRKAQEAYDAL